MLKSFFLKGSIKDNSSPIDGSTTDHAFVPSQTLSKFLSDSKSQIEERPINEKKIFLWVLDRNSISRTKRIEIGSFSLNNKRITFGYFDIFAYRET